MMTDDEVEVSNDPGLRPAAIRCAAGFVANMHGIDVCLSDNRDVPRAEYTRILLNDDNPLACQVQGGERDGEEFWWLFTEADVPEILKAANLRIERWTAAGEQWGISGEDGPE
jgi:hypothetical protein